MEQDLMTKLPRELLTIILSKLPIRTIGISKCVCKSLLHLLETNEFLKFYLSKSAAALAVLTTSSRCTVFDLEDEIDVDQSFDCGYTIAERGLICVEKNEVNTDALYLCNPLTNFDFPHTCVKIEGSANGLLFLHQYGENALYICNPITREYIELHCPKEIFIPLSCAYGFGVSKLTGQYKVVQITDNGCQVYTLDTRSWRRVEAPPTSFDFYACLAHGAFVNGNLHWLVSADSVDTLCISCFDLERECFSTFFVTPFHEGLYIYELHVLRDCLCYCDTISQNGQIVIWLMKEYGDEKSWIKEYVINLYPEIDEIDDEIDEIDDATDDDIDDEIDEIDDATDDEIYYENDDDYVFVYPIKVLEGGGILMVWEGKFISYYSNKTKTTQNIGAFDVRGSYINPMLLTPSFLSLNSFGMENVISF